MAFLIELKNEDGKVIDTYIRETEQEAKDFCDEMNALNKTIGFEDQTYTYKEFLGRE